MTEDELNREHAALVAEHASLEAEHARLEAEPKDMAGHIAHGKRLRAHLARLHAYMKARGYAVPRSARST
jgi:hypothetical protein